MTSIVAVVKWEYEARLLTLLLARGLDHIAEQILSYVDAASLTAAELVCKEWRRVIADGSLWRKLIEHKVLSDTLWKGLAERKGWYVPLFSTVSAALFAAISLLLLCFALLTSHRASTAETVQVMPLRRTLASSP